MTKEARASPLYERVPNISHKKLNNSFLSSPEPKAPGELIV